MADDEDNSEEKNPFLDEIRAGIGPAAMSTQNTKDAIENSNLSEEKKAEVRRALDDLKKKMSEIDDILAALKKREQLEKNDPKRTERLLTEIKVPSLEMLK